MTRPPRSACLLLTPWLLAGCLGPRYTGDEGGWDGDGGDLMGGEADEAGPDDDPSDPDDAPNIPGGADDGGSQEIPSDLERGPGAIVDCDGELSSWRVPDPSAPLLWVGGVYETHGNHGGGNHPEGEATVSWNVPGRNTLVLGSYEPVHWTIEVAPGAALERVIITGYHPQRVSAPAGLDVEIYALESGASQWACGFKLPGDGGGCEGEELVAFAQEVTGLGMYAFDGCYQATRFEYFE